AMWASSWPRCGSPRTGPKHSFLPTVSKRVVFRVHDLEVSAIASIPRSLSLTGGPMRTKLIVAVATVAAAMLPVAGTTAANAAPRGSGEPIAALNAISADGTIAVGADSI